MSPAVDASHRTAAPPRSVTVTHRGRTLHLQPWGLAAAATLSALYLLSVRAVWHGSAWDVVPGGLLFAGVVLLSVLAHETGHAVAAACHGHRVSGMSIGIAGRVFLDDRPLTGRPLIVVSTAGPVSGLLFDAAVIAITGVVDTITVFGLAAALSAYVCAMSELLNLLVPVSGNSDAKNLYRGIREVRAG